MSQLAPTVRFPAPGTPAQGTPARADVPRVLLGPGPSDVAPAVLAALARPTLGHLDPDFLRLMDESSAMLRQAFKTQNPLTLAISGTGSSGMEACIVNLIEPGDEMIVCVQGYFGARMLEMADRCGATVHAIEVPWGRNIDPQQVQDALAAYPRTKVLGIVHAETSTGAHQPLTEISELVHRAGALLLVDAVTSLGGIPLEVDAWKIDACFSGTQKCLSCPPGLAPVTFSPAAVAAINQRRRKVWSWYFDMSLISQYWGGERAYHHTAPINMNYALHEGLRLLLAEGLDARIARHERNYRAMRAGLEALGLRYIPERSLTTLNAVEIPAGVDDLKVRRLLLTTYGIEIGGGLGIFKNKAWRIGIMGHSSSQRNVLMCLAALEVLLAAEGIACEPGAAIHAAHQVYRTDPAEP